MTKNNLLEKAKEYAFNKHDLPSESQRYGNAPYSKHINDVLNKATEYIYYINENDKEDVLSACALHDTIEDTDTSPAKLSTTFNNRIADLVLRVSNERGWSRKEKNFKTYPKIWQSDLAIFIKLCDRISNTFNSKNSDDEKGKRMYKLYVEEYPIFRYALKIKNLYSNMWNELDELNNFKNCSCFNK